MKNLLTHNLVDTLGDSEVSDSFKIENNWNDDYCQPHRFSVKSRPIAVSSEVHTNDLKSAYTRIESRKKEALYKMNVQYNILLKMRKDYMSLTKESMHIQKELNTRETLIRVNQNSSISRKVKMQVDKVKQSICEHQDEVNKIVVDGKIMDGSTKAMLNIGEMEIPTIQPSTSKDTSLAGFEPAENDTNEDKQSTESKHTPEKDLVVDDGGTDNGAAESMDVDVSSIHEDDSSKFVPENDTEMKSEVVDKEDSEHFQSEKSLDMDVDLLSPDIFK